MRTYKLQENRIYLPHARAKWVGEPVRENCMEITVRCNSTKGYYRLYVKPETIDRNKFNLLEDLIRNEKVILNGCFIIEIRFYDLIIMKYKFLDSENDTPIPLYFLVKEWEDIEVLNNYKNIGEYTL